MVQINVNASSHSKAAEEAASVRQQLLKAGLPEATCDDVARQVEELLTPLLGTARTALANRSGVNIKQTLEGEGYSIQLRVTNGALASRFIRWLSTLGLKR